MPPRSLLASLFVAVLTLPTLCFTQAESKPFSRLGIAIKISLLGAGVEAATPLTHRSNLRAGFNLFTYDRSFNSDGVTYTGQLRFRSTEAHYDWFPFGGSFHLSPGVLIYNGNQITANASVPGGKTFTLDKTVHQRPRRPNHRHRQTRLQQSRTNVHRRLGKPPPPQPPSLQRPPRSRVHFTPALPAPPSTSAEALATRTA